MKPHWLQTLERLARNAELIANEYGDEPEKQERHRIEAEELREIASYLRAVSPTAGARPR